MEMKALTVARAVLIEGSPGRCGGCEEGGLCQVMEMESNLLVEGSEGLGRSRGSPGMKSQCPGRRSNLGPHKEHENQV